MNNSKIIIITRSSAYLDEQGNKPKNGREKYGYHILKELKGESSFSNNKNSVKKFFKTWGILVKCDDENFKEEVIKVLNDQNLGKITFPENMYDLDEMKFHVYKFLVDKDTFLTNEEKENKCYVSFENDGHDIILLLWDKLSDDPEEKIEYFDWFLQCLCKDCELMGNENILYIHDKQLLGIQKEDEILDAKRTEIVTNYKNEPFYNSLKKSFKYVVSFGHMQDDGIFNKYILSFKFGNIKPSLIAEEEKKATSFEELREKIGTIINI